MIIFQGSADRLVERILAQVRPTNWEKYTAQRRVHVNGRSCTRISITDDHGTSIVEYWLIEGAGHAWSGGKPSGSYTEASGPASSEMIRFFLGAN